MKNRLRLIMVLLLILPGSVYPADEPTLGESERTDQAETEQEEPEASASPAADNLKSTDLGEAFRNFRPSEEISADNAVSFPVDI